MIEVDVRAALIAASAVTALVGQRIAAGIMPEGEARPYVTYSLVSGERIPSMTDNGILRHARIQLNCFAVTYASAKQIALAVQTAIEASALFEVVLIDDQDLYDPETNLFYVVIQYSVWQPTE